MEKTRNILLGFIACACLLCALPARAAENVGQQVRTERIVGLLAEINRVPRCSHNEEKIAAWLEAWGRERGFPVVRDAADNVVISVAARGGMDNAPTVILQAHMDMVCVKTPESDHDFSKDPIKHIYGLLPSIHCQRRCHDRFYAPLWARFVRFEIRLSGVNTGRFLFTGNCCGDTRLVDIRLFPFDRYPLE